RIDSCGHVRQAQIERWSDWLVQALTILHGCGEQVWTFGSTPEVAETHGIRVDMRLPTHKQRNGCPHLGTLGIKITLENARVWLAFWGELARFIFVAIQTIDPDLVECLQVALAHTGERQAIEPGVIGDIADNALASTLNNAPLGHTEEAHIEIVQPLALRGRGAPGGAIGVGQVAFFVYRQASEAVVGRITENDQDRHVALDVLGSVTFGFQLREEQVLLGASRWDPTGEGVGQVDSGPFVGAVREWSA